MGGITEILKLKGDREFFVPEGYLQVIEGGGVYRDYEYLVTFTNMSTRCGYVAIPEYHRYSTLHDNDYDTPSIECHGGITFVNRNHILKSLLTIPCTDIWIGFDCAHALDGRCVDSAKKYFGTNELLEKISEFYSGFNYIVRSYKYVEDECKKIIDQLVDIGQ